MKIRRRNLILALVIAAWLMVFAVSCSTPVSSPGAEPGTSARSTDDDDDALLEDPRSGIEANADHGELISPGFQHD